jgi:23S rRNA pseudouridine955/2504/2580 synthase
LTDSVLFEDDRLLVIDKPPGIAVHGGSGRSFGVIEALRAARTDCRYLELVHRLDRDTSGCLMIAKKRSYLRLLHELLRSGGFSKNYMALVRGSWQQGTVLLENKLRTDKGGSGERLVRLDESGKNARSRFSPIEDLRIATLMNIALLTGKTHQIRVQAMAAGHPLGGDEKYGEKEFNDQMSRYGLRRIFLHASSLSYEDPVSGEPRVFSCPLPDDLRMVLDRMNQSRG